MRAHSPIVVNPYRQFGASRDSWNLRVPAFFLAARHAAGRRPERWAAVKVARDRCQVWVCAAMATVNLRMASNAPMHPCPVMPLTATALSAMCPRHHPPAIRLVGSAGGKADQKIAGLKVPEAQSRKKSSEGHASVQREASSPYAAEDTQDWRPQ